MVIESILNPLELRLIVRALSLLLPCHNEQSVVARGSAEVNSRQTAYHSAEFCLYADRFSVAIQQQMQLTCSCYIYAFFKTNICRI